MLDWTHGGLRSGALDHLGRLCLVPIVLRYTDAYLVRTERGCLMGQQLSWLILCLVNIWAADEVNWSYPPDSLHTLRR